MNTRSLMLVLCLVIVVAIVGCDGSSETEGDTGGTGTTGGDSGTTGGDTGTTGGDTGTTGGDTGTTGGDTGTTGGDTGTSGGETGSTGDDTGSTGSDDGYPEPLYTQVGKYEVTVAVVNDPADIYFPDPSDLETNDEVYPVFLFLQGAKVDKGQYSQFAEIVASYGFIVVIPNHQKPLMGLSPEPIQLNRVMDQMKKENEDASSPVMGHVDTTKLLVAGHSYGGLAGINALRNVCQPPTCMSGSYTRPPETIAGIFWGTNLEIPIIGGGIPNINNDLPIGFVQGSVDGLAKVSGTVKTYNKVQNPPKVYIEFEGSNHYGICNVNNPGGAQKDSRQPTLDQATGVSAISRWTALFLRAHAYGDEVAEDFVYNSGAALDDVVTVTGEQD